LHYLQAHLPPSAPVKLPRRYITRPDNIGGEAHIEISREGFRWQAALGNFAMHWESHGYAYGISREIDTWLAAGFHVVINGSRHYLENAREHYPTLQPVLVRVSHDALRQRLTRRARETEDEIQQRLQRGEALDRQLSHEDLTILNNDGPLETAGETLLELILSFSPQQTEVRRVRVVAG